MMKQKRCLTGQKQLFISTSQLWFSIIIATHDASAALPLQKASGLMAVCVFMQG